MPSSFELPPTASIRNDVMSVRFSVEERKVIDILAEHLHMAPSRLIREFALQAVEHFVAELGLERGLSTPAAGREEEDE